MNRPVVIALAVAVGVLLLANGSAQSGLRPVVWPQERVLLIGDSLAVGLEDPMEKALRARNVGAFKSIAVGGTMINQWAWSGSHPHARSLDAALADLLQLLGQNNMKAMAAFAALRAGLADRLEPGELAALAEAIGLLRFERAARLVQAILERKGDA